ncbi:MAG TPA: hypothetical protein VK211_00660 [Kamptonema sp.]|nr:hypothetical protein [Kamptonema sp.]
MLQPLPVDLCHWMSWMRRSIRTVSGIVNATLRSHLQIMVEAAQLNYW